MPVIPPLGTGLSPLLQWLIVPGIGLLYAGRKSRPEAAATVSSRFRHEN